MTVTSSKVRIYDLAKELKLDTKRLIEEVRREGVDVSVPSNSVSKELADKIRNKYFPKKEATVKRAVRVVKKAARPVVEEAPAPVEEAEVEAQPEPEISRTEAAPAEPVSTAAPAPKPGPTRLVRKLAPAARAEQPESAEPRAPVDELPADLTEEDFTPAESAEAAVPEPAPVST